MINLLLLIIFVTCLGIASAWVAENPGQVTMYWFDYRIDTSFAFLLLLAIATAFILAYFYIMVRKLIMAPGQISTARQLKKHRKGLTEITYSVAALASADIKHAERHTKKAERLLGQTPLTLLLSAQIARSQGDDTKSRALLESLLDHKETEYLAARSLSDFATKQQLFPKAVAMAERAHQINPKDTSASTAMVGLYIRLGQWQEALEAITKSRLKHGEKQHYRGLVHLKQGCT
jgi:HemY protein